MIPDFKPGRTQQRDGTGRAAAVLLIIGIFAITRAFAMIGEARLEAEDDYADASEAAQAYSDQIDRERSRSRGRHRRP